MESKDLPDRETLSERVYATLKEAILSGELRQGERIGELSVSARFGVSATPVREALRLLHGDGLVHFEGRRGARVIRPSPEEVRSSYAARTLIETAALREAVGSFTEAELAAFLELAERTGQRFADAMGYVEADRQFHEFFIARTGNHWYLKFYREISNFLLIVRLPRMSGGRIDISAREHVAIARAAARRDAEEAVAILSGQIGRSMQWALEACAARDR